MVGSGGGGVHAVIRHDHGDVRWPQTRLQIGQLAVEGGQGVGITGGVVAVAVGHVKFHQIGKQQPFELLFGEGDRGGHGFVIFGGVGRAGDALVGEQVVNLAGG